MAQHQFMNFSPILIIFDVTGRVRLPIRPHEPGLMVAGGAAWAGCYADSPLSGDAQSDCPWDASAMVSASSERWYR